MSEINCDICIIGAGSAGLAIAAGAAQMGAKTVLIEAGKMGGDCLNTGCVPSKSLLAAAKVAHGVRVATRFGVNTAAPNIDFLAVRRHVLGVIAAIAPHDSEERFRELGCTVLRERAQFCDERTVSAGEAKVRARRFVIATGSRPKIPSIPGIDSVAFLTNETVFDLVDLPRHLIIVGAGPIGCEMAQAFRRLGSEVTLLDVDLMMPKDDRDAVGVVRECLVKEGIELIEKADIEQAIRTDGGVGVELVGGRKIDGSHLLVAAGRGPNVEELHLELAGVAFSTKGVQVDGRLRTTNKRIFAAGDVTGGPQFTHWAGYSAGIIVRNALFRLPGSTSAKGLPWVTYTDPELAQVGLTEEEARKIHGAGVRVLRSEFVDNDRARAERHIEGFVKVILGKRGHILGSTIVGSQAGELIQCWGLAISAGLRIGKFAGMISPYPTLGEINRRVAGSYYTPALFSPRTRWIVRLIGKLG